MLLYIIGIIIKNLIVILPALIGVALFTLVERKIIGYIQRRKGPNKVGFLGILQPFADGLKLMMKEPVVPSNSNFLMYIAAPMLTLLLSLVS
jgi:NADH:ubiquinone oxidoreductase subunit H